MRAITDPDVRNTDPCYWERVLRSHGLGMSRWMYIRDGGKGKGQRILLTQNLYRCQDGRTNEQLLDSLAGSNFQQRLADMHAEDRLQQLITKFLSLSPREAAARYGLHPLTAYRLQKEFFEERAARPEVIAARKAWGITDEETNIVELPVIKAALFLAMGEAA